MVGLGRGLEEGTVPALGDLRRLLHGHLPVDLVTLVAHQHDGDGLHVAFDLHDLVVDGLELFQRLSGRDGEDEDEGVALGDGQALHGGELVAARRVCDLQRAHLLVAGDHLAVRVLDRRDVGLAERAPYKAQHERALAHAPGPEHHHPVVVALLWHHAQPHGSVLRRLGTQERQIDEIIIRLVCCA